MNPSVAQLATAFSRFLELQTRAGKITAATADWYRYGLRRITSATVPADDLSEFAGTPVGSMPADRLREIHLVEVNVTNQVARSLKYLYQWSIDQALVHSNPFAKLTVPPCGERNRTLSRDEIVRLYRASPRLLRELLFVMRRTMARPGEIRSLTWGQVCFDSRQIELSDFKSKKRRRDKLRVRVFALDRVVHRFLLAKWRRAGSPSAEAPVFVDRDGKQWTKNACRCAMRRARARAGLGPDDSGESIVCYTLRHTSGTTAIANGVPLKILSEQMGHTNTKTTERYVHVRPDHLQAFIETATQRPSYLQSRGPGREEAQPEKRDDAQRASREAADRLAGGQAPGTHATGA